VTVWAATGGVRTAFQGSLDLGDKKLLHLGYTIDGKITQSDAIAGFQKIFFQWGEFHLDQYTRPWGEQWNSKVVLGYTPPMSVLYSLHRYFRTRQAKRAVIAKDLVALERALYLGANPDGVARRCERGYQGKFEHMLHVAVMYRWTEGVEALLRAGANTEIRGGINLATPLFMAAELRDPKTMMALATHGAHPHGLGWAIDHRALDDTMEVVGGDYPSQGALVSVREMTAEEIVDYWRDSEERKALDVALTQHAVKQTAAALEESTLEAGSTQVRARL
jgi:hypothetical protein